MIERNLGCPDETELSAFVTGDLKEVRLEQLAEHIDGCMPCGTLVDRFSQQGDSGLVDELRAMSLSLNEMDGPCDSTEHEVPAHLLKAAKNAASETTPPISLDAGRRLANKLKEGPIRLGRYELKSELGVGSFGYVFKALDTQLDRFVALKVQRAGDLVTPEDVERFMGEAKSVAKLNHHAIVSVYDTGRSDDDICYLVTEYVEGESLESSLAIRKYSIQESAEMIASVGEAIQYAHENGIVHRDIKPSNILLDRSNKPHVMDFGLAKRNVDSDQALTSIGRVMGTPAYMSPEQALGDSSRVDARCDVYSLGVVLYEMLTGERPFQGDRRMLLLQVVEDEPRSPRRLQPDIPLDLETICLKALSKSRSRRYQSAGELVQDLRCFSKGKPIKARPMGVIEKLWRWSRSYPLAASLLLAIPMVSIGGFAYLSSLSTQFVHDTALESTRMEANMLEDINEYYSESVVGVLDQEKVPVTHLYENTPNSVPLPFTFMIDAGKRITEGESGMQVKIYSDYPWRENSGPQDDFEWRAIEALGLGCRTEAPEEDVAAVRTSTKADVDGRSYHEFVDVKGEPTLRYARAQIMKQSCVECHNNHASSPKRDWIVGEVAGVLSITRPLKRDVESTRSGLRGAFNLIAFVATSLTGVALLVLLNARKIGVAFNERG